MPQSHMNSILLYTTSPLQIDSQYTYVLLGIQYKIKTIDRQKKHIATNPHQDPPS